jgi:clan AA aspartic protease (TIGR02281 family)
VLWLAASVFAAGEASAGAFEEGRDFFQAGHYRWALEKFLEAVDQAPQDAYRRWHLAETYRTLGEGSAAAHEYREILKSGSQSPLAAAARRSLQSLGEPALARVQVPFQHVGTSILLPARVNGQDLGVFILDTGASFISLTSAAAASLGLASGGSSVRLLTANGEIRAPLALLDEVEIGGAVAHHVPAVIHDLPNVPPSIIGLLGLSFLERFRMSLDLSGGVLVLETGN